MLILYITIIKMTTLASVVSMYEIMHSANAIVQQTYRPIEAYALVAVFFTILIVPLAAIARRLEQTSIFRRRSL
jgi:polar amino acid transport system permease protein